jgi:uncharacterized integral membrane protein
VADDLQGEPIPASDSTRFAPGVGPHEAGPAMIEQTTPDQIPAEQTPAEQPPRATNAGRLWIALTVATVLLALLIIFIAENSRKVTISFLGANGTLSLALAMLIAAVAGALITLLVGTTRILQLRREVHRQNKAVSQSGSPPSS